jgi:PPOX class probable FMN-dependent enzyme
VSKISSLEELAAIYGEPGETSTVKEVSYLTADYRRLIEVSPFAVLATSGPEGLDCSPRGDQPGFVHIVDDKTLLLPDRRGNNRIDSLRNIVRDPRTAMLFLLPGLGTTLRVNGRAHISIDENWLKQFVVEGKRPRSVIVLAIDSVYFQCARAIVRSQLWNADRHLDPKLLPTPGDILATLSNNKVGGSAYDCEWPERAKNSMW